MVLCPERGIRSDSPCQPTETVLTRYLNERCAHTTQVSGIEKGAKRDTAAEEVPEPYASVKTMLR